MTVAVHRIEGWTPTDEHLAALAALSGGNLTFGDYLSVFRARHPPPQRHRRRPGLRRPVPYFIPGTTLLRNNFGAMSAEALADLEFTATAGRMVQWLCRPPTHAPPDLPDARVMHRHLFADAYSWAGEYRTTDLRRGAHGFAWQSTVSTRMAQWHHSVRETISISDEYDDPRLSYEMARIYADFNQIHPFREGNGRTGALLLQTVAQACGRRLDLTDVPRGAWYAAAMDSMPFRRDGRASHRPFLYLLGPALRAD